MIAPFCNCREKKEKRETRVGIFQDSLPSRVGKSTAISDRFWKGGGVSGVYVSGEGGEKKEQDLGKVR